MKYIRNALDAIFFIVHPLFKPPRVQQFLRRYIALPYSMAKSLQYKGLVTFIVNGQTLSMQSYNTPIEITVFWRGVFNGREGQELRVWNHLIKNASIILDIGANNGLYSLVASTNKSATVYAFEPVPFVTSMLKENITLSEAENIFVETSVVGDMVGRTTLYVPQSGWVDVASLKPEFAKKFVGTGDLKELSCTMVTVDSFLTDHNVGHETLIVCKIDVEGAEDKVIAGMQNTLRDRKIIFLAELLNEIDFNTVKKLVPKEYSVFAINTVKKRLDLCTSKNINAMNYLFIKIPEPLLLDGISISKIDSSILNSF